jgi:hypothetical protein
MVEARGRTSKPREGAPRPSGGRSTTGSRRPALKPPTLRSSAIKALFGAAILFLFFRFLSDDTTTSQAITMSLVALVLYTPIMFLTDRWIYNRKLKQQQGAGRR